MKQGKVFLFHFESSFRFCDNQILTFQVFEGHKVIKYLSMKHETILLNREVYTLVMKFG